MYLPLSVKIVPNLNSPNDNYHNHDDDDVIEADDLNCERMGETFSAHDIKTPMFTFGVYVH